MSAGWSRRRILREIQRWDWGCRWEGLEEVLKGGSRCRLEEILLNKGGVRDVSGKV